MRSLILLSSSLLLFSSLNASFYDRSMEGRYWYAEKQEDRDTKAQITEENAVEELQLFRHRVDRAKALAVLAPTKDNVKHYMILQQQLVNHSENFSKTWEKLLLEEASLNGQLSNPTAQYAINARKDLEYEKIDTLLEENRTKLFLLFVYDSREKFSQIAGQMMKNFMEDTNWEVLGVSVDQGNLPEFPHSKIAADQGEALGITSTPSYVVINKEAEEVIHVGFGALSVSQLKENIYIQLKGSS